MATPTFFYPELDAGHTTGHLSPAESAHALKSRRLKRGAAVLLLNGRGITATAEVIDVDNRQLKFRIGQVRQSDKPVNAVTVAVAIPKGNRQRFLVEMLTQLGATEIIPLQCEYSSVACKQETCQRWSRFALEACKQSHNPWLPAIPAGGTPESILSRLNERQGRIVYADQGGESAAAFRDCGPHITAFVGPEGGFSPTEVALFNAAAVKPVCLGEHVLRTETAAAVATALLTRP